MSVQTRSLSVAVAQKPHAGPTAPTLAKRRWHAFARNRLAVLSVGFLLVVHGLAILAPMLAPYAPEKISPAEALRLPSMTHLLGTDEVGRDVFSRLLYGGRISLAVGLSAMAISVVLGVIVGALGGFRGGTVDAVLMRATDAMMAIPTFFLLLLALTIFGGSTLTIVLVIGLTSWMSVARLVRAEVLRFSSMEFVTAARTLGASSLRLLTLHVLPQAWPTIIVAASLGVGYAILTESALSYLGLGVQPPTPSWGNMLQNAQQYIFNAPLVAVYPGVLVFGTVLAYNFLGDGIRDALDPNLLG